MPSLLLIDDDKDVLILNRNFFLHEGFEVKVSQNIQNACNILKTYKPDCIVLDVMMPGIDGFTGLPEIQKLSLAPIIFLTGLVQEENKIKGLLLGANDYMIKPYSLKELSARIQVQIRLHQPATSIATTRISYPPFTLDIPAHKFFYNQTEVILSNREYELLYLLVSNANITMTFEQIGKAMWGIYNESDRRTIMVIASRLRKRIEEYTNDTDIIETVWSQGYIYNPKK